MTLHLLKLAVGVDDLAELRQAAARARARSAASIASTRATCRAAHEEMLDGGSIYWVIKGHVAGAPAHPRLRADRQPARPAGGAGEARGEGDRRPQWQPRRAFQGWRYLEPEEAPRDLPKRGPRRGRCPPAMAQELRELGLL